MMKTILRTVIPAVALAGLPAAVMVAVPLAAFGEGREEVSDIAEGIPGEHRIKVCARAKTFANAKAMTRTKGRLRNTSVSCECEKEDDDNVLGPTYICEATATYTVDE